MSFVVSQRSPKYYNITTTLQKDNGQQTTDNGGRQPVFRPSSFAFLPLSLLSFVFRRSSANPAQGSLLVAHSFSILSLPTFVLSFFVVSLRSPGVALRRRNTKINNNKVYHHFFDSFFFELFSMLTDFVCIASEKTIMSYKAKRSIFSTLSGVMVLFSPNTVPLISNLATIFFMVSSPIP